MQHPVAPPQRESSFRALPIGRNLPNHGVMDVVVKNMSESSVSENSMALKLPNLAILETWFERETGRSPNETVEAGRSLNEVPITVN